MSHGSGFTIVEFLMILVILAILVLTAVPGFLHSSSEARQKVADGLAKALESAAAKGRASNCAQAGEVIPGGLDADFSIKGSRPKKGVLHCTLVHQKGETAEFTVQLR